MSLNYEASTLIDASPQTVWAVLLDTAKWPEWDPFCIRIDGEVKLGNKVTAWTKLSPKRGFPVKVTELTPNQRMVWSGGMPFGLFKGVRTYSLEAQGGKTSFSMREEFSGPMLFMIKGSLPDMTEPFQAFVDGLKARAEEVAA